ncbi:hypothetical protein AB6A40_003532 [Gnathostoma spinigerum]|uniref:Amino acid transporter transmembrane domain-containing protein n=1 Tax=Gnathostoma spinigerum TaxID=75299 RepID=A0ABD6E9V1_9BILA
MSIHYVENFRWKFPALTGTLALSFFIHNAILTILRTQRNPENNGRDLFIGYALATSCYVFIGTIFYSTFPTVRSCIADNLLNNFGTGDVMSAIARMFLLLQMLSVFPLLIYFIRIQLFHVLFEEVYPGLMHVLILNLLILTLAILIAMFYPHVGGILRYIGSFVGVFYLFALPCAVYMMKLKAEGRLTKFQVVIHGALIAFGCVNFFSQFLIH